MVPDQSPVSSNDKEERIASPMEETLVRFECPFVELPFSTIAERSIGRKFTVAQFIVAALTHIEGDGTTSGHQEFALTIAEGLVPGVTA